MESKPRSINDANTEPCDVCGIMVKRKTDMRRHKLIHDKRYALAPVYPCTFEHCTYSALQKSNLATHMRTHTGEKPHACPDCTFTTADPGSLTRHKKARHGYQPKSRVSTGKAATSRKGKRASPYERRTSVSSTDSGTLSSSSDGSFGSPETPDDKCYLNAALSNIAFYPSLDPSQCYAWNKFLEETCNQLDRVLTSSDAQITNPVIPVLDQASPKQILPANEVVHQLEGWEFFNFDNVHPDNWMYDTELLPPMFSPQQSPSTVQALVADAADDNAQVPKHSATSPNPGSYDPLAQMLCQVSQPFTSPHETGLSGLCLTNFVPPCNDSNAEVPDLGPLMQDLTDDSLFHLVALPEPIPSPASSLTDFPDIFSEEQIIQTFQLGPFVNALCLS